MRGDRLPRRRIIGKRIGPPAEEVEHFVRCETCGGWVDLRDLAQVLDHQGPLPHPAEDQEQ